METVSAMRHEADKASLAVEPQRTNDPGLCTMIEALRLEIRAFAMMVEREAKLTREDE